MPACVPTTSAVRLMCIFSALSWQQVAGSAREDISLCLFSPFQHNPTLVKSCGVTMDAMYPFFTKLFLLPAACMPWFCLPDFERLLSPFFAVGICSKGPSP